MSDRPLIARLPQGLLPAEMFMATQLSLPLGLAYEKREAVGNLLAHIEAASAWWWGDWCVYGENAYGEQWASARALADRAYSTIVHWTSVARPFSEFGRRRPNLSWKHHQAVCRLRLGPDRISPPDTAAQDEWLARAERGDGPGTPWSAARLRDELAKTFGKRPWDLDEALDCLDAAVRAIVRRWPAGEKARTSLGQRLCALGEVLRGGDLGA